MHITVVYTYSPYSLLPGPALVSVGPDFKTLLRGPTQLCREMFDGMRQGIMIELVDVKKVGPKE